MKKRVLFVAENVTLAQVVRLVTLARSLDPQRFEVHFASADFPDLVFGGLPFVQHQLVTLDAKVAAKALESGKRLYEKRALVSYVRAELQLMQDVQPDLVVGDFRLSLSTSAELHGVPCGVLINAYWSPYAQRESWPVPDHPIVSLVGEQMAARYFPQAMDRVFKHFAAPINAMRRKFGLPAVGSLLEVLSHGDYTLYPDDPWLTPVVDAPDTHRFIGPVPWEPDVPALELPFDLGRPLVYVTLGSSGKVDVLPMVVEALAQLPLDFVLATAGRSVPFELPPNGVVVPFVRGSELARRANLVISNGGSTTGYQALAEGTPVIGVPSNFDQFLASQAMVKAGAGLEVKAREASVPAIQQAVQRALRDDTLKQRALNVAKRFAQHDSRDLFNRWVDETVSAPVTRQSAQR